MDAEIIEPYDIGMALDEIDTSLIDQEVEIFDGDERYGDDIAECHRTYATGLRIEDEIDRTYEWT